jgi:outer membrane immunogenic protein
MKKTSALTLTILCVLGAFAYAGPEPYSGKDMKQVVPVVPECPNWTGFYVGGFAGYKFASADVALDLFGGWDGTDPNRDPFDRDTIEPLGSEDLDTSGFEAGGILGYNYQFNNSHWVIGVEASAAYLWVDDATNTGPFSPAGSISTYNNLHTSFEMNYLATVGGRIGYAFCKWLPYVTGGVAFGDIDFHQEIVQGDIVFNEGGSKHDTEIGWMVGGGLQYSIADHWSVRGQYQFVDLGSVSFDSVGDTDTRYLGHHEIDVKVHNASVALIYGF